MNTSLLGELNESFNKEGNELGQRPLFVVVHAKEHTDYNQIDVQTSLPIISISSFRLRKSAESIDGAILTIISNVDKHVFKQFHEFVKGCQVKAFAGRMDSPECRTE